MMEETLQLDLPLLLPGVPDERDQCVERLMERVSTQRGIARAHLDRKGGDAVLCLHYDAHLVTLAQVRRLAEQAGSEVSGRYCHETLRIEGMDCADDEG